MNNPLLSNTALPLFSDIKPEHIEPAIDEILQAARALIDDRLQTRKNYSWDLLVQPLEDLENQLHKAWSPIEHLNSVMNNEALRTAYNACLPKLSDYATEVGQNKSLFNAYRIIAKSSEFSEFDTAQQKIIRNALKDFRLSGIDLSEEQKQRYKEIAQELSKFTSRFSDNVLDATNAWSKLITHKQELAGLSESALAQAKEAAEQRGEDGWLLTLQYPSYQAVMTYADDWDLRAEVYEAFVTRASDQGPQYPDQNWDNTVIMDQILALRHEKAQLLGFNNYAEYSLATKMANKTDEVMQFLEDLANKSWRQARNDFIDLKAFVTEHYHFSDLEPWDIQYYSEKMRRHNYKVSQEQIKQYFPVDKVLTGLFNIVEKLYGIQINELKDFDTWHESVRFFDIHKDGELRGQFYFDLYARANKRGGAWMADCAGRRKTGDTIQTPVAFLICNFTPPTADLPSLLTHDEVTTLFHEFGHGLHHLLTQINHLGVSGINGVEWDAVELPSQFMENWCWDKQAIALISGHYQTGETLPDDLFDKMLATKNFQAGMMMVRQLEFALFDFRLHRDYIPDKSGQVQETLDKVRKQVAVLPIAKFNRMAHSFSHIFAGGYAAGYYSYKWAEVLSCDAFSLFEEQGIFNQEAGQSFLENILEKGGSEDAMSLFIKFRGRKPTIDALLRQNGIEE